MKAWIPLVKSTYQVISVLLHCFTAEKSHKTWGGWDRNNTDYCSSDSTEENRTKMHYYCYNNKTNWNYDKTLIYYYRIADWII